ncbi:MAG: hypothetical protein RL377_265 [Bacteroidota bacterium]|jgi:hypothetical protein
MGFLFYKRKRVLCCAFLISSQGLMSSQPLLFAQVPSFQQFHNSFVFNTTGGSKNINDLRFDWSVGASIQFTATAPEYEWILSFGFLQNDYDKALLYKTKDSFALQIKLGPNPFSDHLIIQCNQEGITITGLQLMDLFGTTLFISTESHSGIHYYEQLHLNKLKYPACVLVVYYTIADGNSSSRKYKLVQN